MSEADVMTGPGRAGELLRQAREAAGLQLAEVAARTRIPQRHLEAIEADDFNALPSTTYSVGFARAYARVVGADEVAIAAAVRSQLDGAMRARHDYQAFEPADPARVPPRGLAWTVGLVALLVLAIYGIWRANWLTAPGSAPPPEVAAPASAPGAPAARAPVAPAAPANGPVVLTAADTVWVRINDATGKRLFEKEMAQGEAYTLPADAAGATITTGRPNMLAVTLGGVAVPPLGEPEKRIRNVGIDAAALRARIAAPAQP
jgi:cytoskeletal protein RodZ